jgi:DNA-binding response OmpR family regulator
MELAASAPGGGRVLVIDDQREHVEIVSALLARHGFVVEAATSSATGIERARRWHPDLILLDLCLPAPSEDGFAIACELARDAATRDVPIVFLSACVEELARARGIDLDLIDYLPKPFSGAELVHAATAALLAARRRRG